MAIESAASIANCIVKMLDTVSSTDVTDKQIEEAFQSYQNARYKRTKRINDFANDLTREESYSTFYRKFLTVWVDPVVDDGYVGGRCRP
jgi:2-polyprenyl-6-methoxyphenol hydroxylase-like FAD-dependent oxidoreductase